MLIDRYPAEDVFARVPEVAAQTGPILMIVSFLDQQVSFCLTP